MKVIEFVMNDRSSARELRKHFKTCTKCKAKGIRGYELHNQKLLCITCSIERFAYYKETDDLPF